MIRRFFLVCIILVYISTLYAQENKNRLYKPVVALKTNFLYWATTTPNLGLEFGLSDKWTLDISGNYNFWDFKDNKKFKHWLVQPELRYWLCERFNGHFFGIHGHYAEYNVGGFELLGFKKLKDYRYEGNLYGGGISYGYHWVLSNRWSIEATIGVGYAHLDYDKYNCGKCGTKIKDDTKNYWGPTKAALSIIYIIK